MPAPMEFLALCIAQTRPNPLPTTVAGQFAHATLFLRCIIRRFGPYCVSDLRFCAALIDRIGRMNTRLAALCAKFEAGALPPPAPLRDRPSRAKPAKPADPTNRLPTRFGWLLNWIQVTVHGRTPLESLLADPDFHTFVQAAPQAGRILRPLCHMLGIRRPAILDAPKRPTKPRPPRARPEPPPEPAPIPAPEPLPAPAWLTAMRKRPDPPRPFRTLPELRHLWGPRQKPA